MIATEFENTQSTALNAISKLGTIVAAGKSSKEAESTKTLTAQFPAGRTAGHDNSDDIRVNDLYKNGLLFTAYNYTSRTTPDLRSMRQKVQTQSKTLQRATAVVNAIKSVKGGADAQTTSSTTKDAVANILMPRSKSDTDTTNHKFNDAGDSLITRGNGTATGILSNVASTAVFGGIESMTQGFLSDQGEQIYNVGRSMYAGAENRTKTYTWDLIPRTREDLLEIVKIYEIFNFYSYGTTGNSQFAKEIKRKIDEWYKTTILKPLAPDGADLSNTWMESVTSFLSNVIVVSNPTVWFIQNFGASSEFDGHTDVFGPAQIASIRFDKSPDGNFSGLAIAPNMPSSFVLEVTFREILTLTRATIYGGDIL